jgi:uncharacterized membrane protein
MKTSAVRNASSPGETFTRIVAIFLLIEGIWGFFSPIVFGVLSTNYLHATIHVLLGLVGLWAASRGFARGFLQGLGCLLMVVGLLWFIPGTRNLVEELFSVNQSVAALNVVLGAISLLVAGVTSRPVDLVEDAR